MTSLWSFTVDVGDCDYVGSGYVCYAVVWSDNGAITYNAHAFVGGDEFDCEANAKPG